MRGEKGKDIGPPHPLLPGGDFTAATFAPKAASRDPPPCLKLSLGQDSSSLCFPSPGEVMASNLMDSCFTIFLLIPCILLPPLQTVLLLTTL